MFGGVNPAQMKSMMKQMGIRQEEIDAVRVIIEKADSQIIMQGQESWQVVGNAREETKEAEISDDDISLVAEKTGKSKEEARRALEAASGDIAEAIVKLGD